MSKNNLNVSTYLPVGVFDSGVGGLSVVSPLVERLPEAQILYVADAAFSPYGEMDAEQVIARSEKITRFLIEQGAASIVVACNTATAIAVDHLRKIFSLPIVAMEPAIKPAMIKSHSKMVAVLATAGTLGSERYANLQQGYLAKGEVIDCVCHDWVRQIEKGDLGSAETISLVEKALLPILETKADVLVLGCTHFPFLEEIIREIINKEIHIINPAPAVVDQLLRVTDMDNNTQEKRKGSLTIWTSGDVETYQQLIPSLIDISAQIKKFY